MHPTDFAPLTVLVADENKCYQEIDVPELMKKVGDKFVSLKDIKVKELVDYITDGININLK